MRATSHIPFPTEERIRMGLMGRLQGAAAEHGPDPDVAVEEIMAEKEREMREKWEEEKRRKEKEEKKEEEEEEEEEEVVVGDLMEHVRSPSQAYIMREPGEEGMEFGLDGVGGGVGGERARVQPQPQGFDLDLFDPDEEDDFE
ncbi:NADH pyrophosphatase, partial [Ascosphaera pollenicola]